LPQYLLKKIGLIESDLKPYNVILSNYEGKSGSSFGAVKVDLVVGTVKRSTLFLVVASKANYNLLLGREWIHDVGLFLQLCIKDPSSLIDCNALFLIKQ